MVFLLKKAAIAALIAAGLTLGAFNYFAQESANRVRNKGGGMFDTTYANRSRPRLFGSNLFPTSLRSDVPCNCQIITECPSIKSGGTIRGRHCGFQGFQRKICCDDEDTTAPVITQEQIDDAYKQKSRVEIYRNPDIFRNEHKSLVVDTGSSQSDEDNNDRVNTGKYGIPLSPMDILSLEDFGRQFSKDKDTPEGVEKANSAEIYSEGDPPAYSGVQRTGADSIESLFPNYYDSEGSDKAPQLVSDDRNRTAKLHQSLLAQFFPDYYDELVESLKTTDKPDSSSSSSNDDDSSSSSSSNSSINTSEPLVLEVSGSTTINPVDTNSSSSTVRPDDNQSSVVTSMSVSMEKSSYVTSKSMMMKDQATATEASRDDSVLTAITNNAPSVPPTSVSMVMSVSGGQTTRNTTSKSITMVAMSSATAEADEGLITNSTESTLSTSTVESANIPSSSTDETSTVLSTSNSTSIGTPSYSEGMISTEILGGRDLTAPSENNEGSTPISMVTGRDESTIVPLSDETMSPTTSTSEMLQEDNAFLNTSSTTSLHESDSSSNSSVDRPTTTLISTFNDSQTTLASSSPFQDEFSFTSTASTSSVATSSPPFVPISESNNNEPSTLPTLSLTESTTPVSFTPEKTTLPSIGLIDSSMTIPQHSLNVSEEYVTDTPLARDESTTGSINLTSELDTDQIGETTTVKTALEINKEIFNHTMIDEMSNNSQISHGSEVAPGEATTPSISPAFNDETTFSSSSRTSTSSQPLTYTEERSTMSTFSISDIPESSQTGPILLSNDSEKMITTTLPSVSGSTESIVAEYPTTGRSLKYSVLDTGDIETTISFTESTELLGLSTVKSLPSVEDITSRSSTIAPTIINPNLSNEINTVTDIPTEEVSRTTIKLNVNDMDGITVSPDKPGSTEIIKEISHSTPQKSRQDDTIMMETDMTTVIPISSSPVSSSTESYGNDFTTKPESSTLSNAVENLIKSQEPESITMKSSSSTTSQIPVTDKNEEITTQMSIGLVSTTSSPQSQTIASTHEFTTTESRPPARDDDPETLPTTVDPRGLASTEIPDVVSHYTASSSVPSVNPEDTDVDKTTTIKSFGKDITVPGIIDSSISSTPFTPALLDIELTTVNTKTLGSDVGELFTLSPMQNDVTSKSAQSLMDMITSTIDSIKDLLSPTESPVVSSNDESLAASTNSPNDLTLLDTSRSIQSTTANTEEEGPTESPADKPTTEKPMEDDSSDMGISTTQLSSEDKLRSYKPMTSKPELRVPTTEQMMETFTESVSDGRFPSDIETTSVTPGRGLTSPNPEKSISVEATTQDSHQSFSPDPQITSSSGIIDSETTIASLQTEKPTTPESSSVSGENKPQLESTSTTQLSPDSVTYAPEVVTSTSNVESVGSTDEPQKTTRGTGESNFAGPETSIPMTTPNPFSITSEDIDVTTKAEGEDETSETIKATTSPASSVSSEGPSVVSTTTTSLNDENVITKTDASSEDTISAMTSPIPSSSEEDSSATLAHTETTTDTSKRYNIEQTAPASIKDESLSSTTLYKDIIMPDDQTFPTTIKPDEPTSFTPELGDLIQTKATTLAPLDDSREGANESHDSSTAASEGVLEDFTKSSLSTESSIEGMTQSTQNLMNNEGVTDIPQSEMSTTGSITTTSSFRHLGTPKQKDDSMSSHVPGGGIKDATAIRSFLEDAMSTLQSFVDSVMTTTTEKYSDDEVDMIAKSNDILTSTTQATSAKETTDVPEFVNPSSSQAPSSIDSTTLSDILEATTGRDEVSRLNSADPVDVITSTELTKSDVDTTEASGTDKSSTYKVPTHVEFTTQAGISDETTLTSDSNEITDDSKTTLVSAYKSSTVKSPSSVGFTTITTPSEPSETSTVRDASTTKSAESAGIITSTTQSETHADTTTESPASEKSWTDKVPSSNELTVSPEMITFKPDATIMADNTNTTATSPEPSTATSPSTIESTTVSDIYDATTTVLPKIMEDVNAMNYKVAKSDGLATFTKQPQSEDYTTEAADYRKTSTDSPSLSNEIITLPGVPETTTMSALSDGETELKPNGDGIVASTSLTKSDFTEMSETTTLKSNKNFETPTTTATVDEPETTSTLITSTVPSVQKPSISTTVKPEETTIFHESSSPSTLMDEVSTSASKSIPPSTDTPEEIFTSINIDIDEPVTSTPSTVQKPLVDVLSTTSAVSNMGDDAGATTPSDQFTGPAAEDIIGTNMPETTPESASLLKDTQTTLSPPNELGKLTYTYVPTTLPTLSSEKSAINPVMIQDEGSTQLPTALESTTLTVTLEDVRPGYPSTTEPQDAENVPSNKTQLNLVDKKDAQYEATTLSSILEGIMKPFQSTIDSIINAVTLKSNGETTTSSSVMMSDSVDSEKMEDKIAITTDSTLINEQSTLSNLDGFTERPTTKGPFSSGSSATQGKEDAHQEIFSTTIMALDMIDSTSQTTVIPSDSSSLRSDSAAGKSIDLSQETFTTPGSPSVSQDMDSTTSKSTDEDSEKTIEMSTSPLKPDRPLSSDFETTTLRSFETTLKEERTSTIVPESSGDTSLPSTNVNLDPMRTEEIATTLATPKGSSLEEQSSKSGSTEVTTVIVTTTSLQDQTTETPLSPGEVDTSTILPGRSSENTQEETTLDSSNIKESSTTNKVDKHENSIVTSTSIPDTTESVDDVITTTPIDMSITDKLNATVGSQISSTKRVHNNTEFTTIKMNDEQLSEISTTDRSPTDTAESALSTTESSMPKRIQLSSTVEAISMKSLGQVLELTTSPNEQKVEETTTMKFAYIESNADDEAMGIMQTSTTSSSNLMREHEEERLPSSTITSFSESTVTSTPVSTRSSSTVKDDEAPMSIPPKSDGIAQVALVDDGTTKSTLGVSGSEDNYEATTRSHDEKKATAGRVTTEKSISEITSAETETPEVVSSTTSPEVSTENTMSKVDSEMDDEILSTSEIPSKGASIDYLDDDDTPSTTVRHQSMFGIMDMNEMETTLSPEAVMSNAFAKATKESETTPKEIPMSPSSTIRRDYDAETVTTSMEFSGVSVSTVPSVRIVTTQRTPEDDFTSTDSIQFGPSTLPSSQMSQDGGASTPPVSQLEATSTRMSRIDDISTTQQPVLSENRATTQSTQSTTGSPMSSSTPSTSGEATGDSTTNENSTNAANSDAMSHSLEMTIEDATTPRTEKVFHKEVGTTTLRSQTATEVTTQTARDVTTSGLESTTPGSDEETNAGETSTTTNHEKFTEPLFVLNITEIFPTKITVLANMSRVIYDDDVSSEERESKEYLTSTEKPASFDQSPITETSESLSQLELNYESTTPITNSALNEIPTSTQSLIMSLQSSTESPDKLEITTTGKSNPYVDPGIDTTTSVIDISSGEMKTVKPEGLEEIKMHSIPSTTIDSDTTDSPPVISTTLSMNQELLEIDGISATTTLSSHKIEPARSTEAGPSLINESVTSLQGLLVPDDDVHTTMSNRATVPTTSISLLTMRNNSSLTSESLLNEIDTEIVMPTTSDFNSDSTTETAIHSSISPVQDSDTDTENSSPNSSTTLNSDDVSETAFSSVTQVSTKNLRDDSNSFVINKTYNIEDVATTEAIVSPEESPTTPKDFDSGTTMNALLSVDEDVSKAPVMSQKDVQSTTELQLHLNSQTSHQSATTESTLQPTSPRYFEDSTEFLSQTTEAAEEKMNASTSVERNEQLENTSVYFLDEPEKTGESTPNTLVEIQTQSTLPMEVTTSPSLTFDEEPVTSVSSRITNETSRLTAFRPTIKPPGDHRTSTDITHSIRKIPESDRTVVELVRQLSKVKTKITHSINAIKNTHIISDDDIETTTEKLLEMSTVPSNIEGMTTTTLSPGVADYPTTSLYGYSSTFDEIPTAPTSPINPTDQLGLEETTTSETTVVNETPTFDEIPDHREAEHLESMKHQMPLNTSRTTNNVHEDKITPTGIIKTTTEITESFVETTNVPTDSMQTGTNESEWEGATRTEDSVLSTTAFTKEWGMEEETFSTTQGSSIMTAAQQTNRSMEISPNSTGPTTHTDIRYSSQSSRHQRLFHGVSFDESNSTSPPITQNTQTALFELDERETTEPSDIPRSTTQITQSEQIYAVEKDDMTPSTLIDFQNETMSVLGNETTERSLQDGAVSNAANPSVSFEHETTVESITPSTLPSNSSDISVITQTTTVTKNVSTTSSIRQVQSAPLPETIVTTNEPPYSQMSTTSETSTFVPPDKVISVKGLISTTPYDNPVNETATTTSYPTTTGHDDEEHIPTSETRFHQAQTQSLLNLFNEIFQPVGPSPVQNSTEKYPHNHHHHNYNPQRKNNRKLILEVVTPPPTTAPPAQEIDVDEDADEFFKTATAISHTGKAELSSTTQESPKLKVSVKVGPGPGRPPKAGRELFPSEAQEIEQQLNNQISNVVNQLLLTTHENFRLLPSFLECAAASSRKARRKTRVLSFDTDNYPWMARIGYSEPGGLTFSCSGTIISQRYILTSATCAQKHDGRITDVLLESAKNLMENNVTQDTSTSRYKLKVQGVYVHPQYDPKSRLNDLALIRLKEEIGFNSTSEIRPICLPFEDGYGIWDSLPQPGDIAYLGGWGFEQKNSTKKIADLSESSVKIWSNQNCSRAYTGDTEKRVTSQQLCAYSSPEAVCRGDGGSPLMAVMTRHRIFLQIGIVSYGPQCGYQVPRVYTRVSEYLKWILDSMDP